jgi:hypothetical protein
MDAPELATKTEAAVKAEETKIESRFQAMWDSFRPQVITLSTVVAILAFTAGHFLHR